MHLNVVRTRQHGLEKTAQPGRRYGMGVAPSATQVNERLRALRSYRWSSYRAYLGLAPACDWLTCHAVRALAGGRTMPEQRRAYRLFVEDALREGLPEDDWQRMERAVVIGGGEFVRRMGTLVRGGKLDQPEVRWFSRGGNFSDIQRAVERVKGERWETFADRYGDWGRDLGLWLGRTKRGLTLKELATSASLGNYRSLTTVIKNFEQRMRHDKIIQRAAERAAKLMTYET